MGFTESELKVLAAADRREFMPSQRKGRSRIRLTRSELGSIHSLNQHGWSVSTISDRLHISRDRVRRALESKGEQ